MEPIVLDGGRQPARLIGVADHVEDVAHGLLDVDAAVLDVDAHDHDVRAECDKRGKHALDTQQSVAGPIERLSLVHHASTAVAARAFDFRRSVRDYRDVFRCRAVCRRGDIDAHLVLLAQLQVEALLVDVLPRVHLFCMAVVELREEAGRCLGRGCTLRQLHV